MSNNCHYYSAPLNSIEDLFKDNIEYKCMKNDSGVCSIDNCPLTDEEKLGMKVINTMIK